MNALPMTGRSHIGLVRKTNEDEYYCDGRNRYLLIADGIGGHQHGQIASKLAVDTAKWCIEENISQKEPLAVLEDAFHRANARVYEYQEKEAQGQLMGTTLTAVILTQDKLYFGHIGDSRAYLLSAGKMPRLLTNDHTYLAELAQHDQQTYQMIASNSVVDKKNTLVRAIGPDEVCVPQFGESDICTGDVILLMTDGMYRYVTNQEIAEIVSYTDNLNEVALRFEQLALERGGKDNATIVIYKREEGDMPCKMF